MPHNESSSREDRVNEAIAAFLEAVERGEAPNREKFLAEHADIAAEVRSFFAEHSQLRQMAEPGKFPPAESAGAPACDPEQPTVHVPMEGLPDSGQVLYDFGDYELLQELGRGGMGVVFKGRDTGIGREIAVKVLLERHHGETELLQRFVEEAQIAGQLQHPGVTPVYEMGQLPDQRPYFTMKLVKGETLSRLLKERPDPTHDRLKFIKIFEQVCQTLAYAHSRGVIHRDLKPANIMVGVFGEVQVMDWGLGKVLGSSGSKAAGSTPAASANVSVIRTARSTAAGDSSGSSSQTQTGRVLGTLAYMPPEQAMGRIDDLDQRADVFGLGAILCEILTGQPPYTGSDAFQVQLKAVRAELTDAFDRLGRCGADSQLTGLARRALAALPADRPTDAGVLAAELTAYLEGAETRLRQAELAEVQAQTRAIEERRRRKQTLVFSGAVLAVLVIGVIGTSWGLIRARAATEAERREGYDGDVELAGQVWENENGTAPYVESLLSRHIPHDGQTDLREFAWRLLWTALHKQSCILKEHDRGARLAAFANEHQLVTLDGDLTLRHWELPAGKIVRSEMRCAAPQVSCWAISRDARRVALGGGDTVHVFDARTSGKMPVFTGRALALALSFSADGQKLAAVWGDGTAEIWDVASGKQTARWLLQELEQLSDLERVALTPDGRNLFLVGYPAHDRITWLGADQRESSGHAGHESTVYSIALTEDGTLGATGDSNGQVSLWNAETREPMGTPLSIHRGNVMALQFSPDATWLATGGADGIVTVWDVARRNLMYSFKGHLGRIHDLSFSPDCHSLASASQDGDVRVWKLAASRQSRVLGVHELPVFSVAWSPDGRRVAVGTGDKSMSTDGIVRIWDVNNGDLVREIRTGKGRVLALVFSANGHALATGAYDSVLRLWDVDSGELLRELEGLASDPTHYQRTAIGTLAISPDGNVIVAGFGSPLFHQSDYDQVAKVWKLASGQELKHLEGHVNTICSVAFSTDGKILATASDDQQVKLWSVGKWQPIGMLSGPERFKSVAFSPNGEWIVTGGETGAITVWETASRRPVRQLTGHTNAVVRVMFSSDGRTLASAGWDGTVKLWDPISGRETRTLREHTDWISCLAFSPDGNILATGSFDKTLRLWEVASEEDVATTLAADRAIAERLKTRDRARQEQRAADGTFTVAATLLDQYAGQYKDGLIIDRQDDHLTIHPIKGARGAAVPLYPKSEHKFVCRDREIDVKFLRDENGQVTRVIVYQAGEAFEAKKQVDSEQVHSTGVKP